MNVQKYHCTISEEVCMYNITKHLTKSKVLFLYPKKKQKKSFCNFEELMKHERVHKKGGGGKISPTQIVTDYECAKIPLHDFKRSMYVQYN